MNALTVPLRLAGLTTAAWLLAGCLISKEPLITEQNADFPLVNGTVIQPYDVDSGEPVEKPEKLTISNGFYTTKKGNTFRFYNIPNSSSYILMVVYEIVTDEKRFDYYFVERDGLFFDVHFIVGEDFMKYKSYIESHGISVPFNFSKVEVIEEGKGAIFDDLEIVANVLTDMVTRGFSQGTIRYKVIEGQSDPQFVNQDNIENLREAAERGDAEAQYRLALELWSGDGMPQDRDEALRLFRSAAAAGNAAAMGALALRLMTGDGVEQDDAEAYRFAAEAARARDGYGAYLVGFALENGRGVPVDVKQAEHWYSVSAALGNVLGETEFARMLEEGDGSEADLQRARELFLGAAQKDNVKAMARLGRMLRTGAGGSRDLKAARRWLERAKDRPIAQHQLGLMMWNGEAGQQDRAGGFALIRRAADAGLADAQVDAARILSTATGGERLRDEAAAVAYLERAAAQDHPDALVLLGARLRDGEGMAKDVERALRLLDRAAALGDTSAADIARNARQLIQIDAWQAQLTELEQLRAEQCRLMIELCNRGCEKQGDGTYIYNTYDGKAWFHESGRLIPKDKAPKFGCPQ